MPLSEDLRNELAAIAPTSDCDRLAELSGLFHSAGSAAPPRARRGLGAPRPREHAVARRAFGFLRAFGVERGDPHLPPPRVRPRDSLSAARRGTAPRAARCCTRRASSTAASRRSSDRRAGSSRERAAARAYLRGALLGGGSLSGPRSPHLEIRATGVAGAEFLAELARRDGLDWRARPRRATRSRTRRRARRSRTCSPTAGASDAVLALEERAVVGATRSRANRLANADHANLVRTSRAAHEQAQAVRALVAAGRLDRCRPSCGRSRRLRLRHPSLSLRELAPNVGRR